MPATFAPMFSFAESRRRDRKAPAKPQKKRSVIGVQQRSIIVDRIESAIETGRLHVTTEFYRELLAVMFPEEDCKQPEPTDTPPGTAERARVYRQRAARGEAVFCRDDAPAPDQDERLARLAGAMFGHYSPQADDDGRD